MRRAPGITGALLRSCWRIREPGVPWGITTVPPSSRHQLLLVAVNRAAAFNVAARWVLHDLRSPAQSLTLMADLIAEPGEDLEGILREACANLARSLELLARVVHHPPSAGELGPISVGEPIAFIADLQRAGRTHARVELDVDPALPPAVGVVRHLEHALLNLVLYATEALRSRDAAVIRIKARREDDRVQIVLGWGAPPVPPEMEARLFELPAEVSPLEQPLAIGLPIAREVVQLSGGTLTYSPDDGPGPCFLLSLPLWRRS
jgi:C4-dicarboxylate-specific signal transduction histidine kinase